jgi:NAD(P)H-hydrate epimerase
VVLLSSPSELAGDAHTNYDTLARAAERIVDLSSVGRSNHKALPFELNRHVAGARWIIDALLGTGAVGAAREPFKTAIEWMNAQPCRRLAVDLPSGLECDAGAGPGVAVQADITCTFVAPKPGLVIAASAPWVGVLQIVDIGVPPKWLVGADCNG